MSKLIIMSGIPGAGKTTYACSIRNAYVVSNDNIRLDLTGGVVLPQRAWNNLPIDDIQEELVIGASQDHDIVILDCAALTNAQRLEYYNKYKNYFNQFEIIHMNTPLRTCIRRNHDRARRVPLKQILKMKLQWQDFSDKVKSVFTIKTIGE